LRAFGKDLACRLVEVGFAVPQDLILLLDEGWTTSPVLTVFFSINLGVVATMPSTRNFLGKSDLLVTVGGTDNGLRAVGHSYNMSFLSCSVGYRWESRVVNVDRLHPAKIALNVSWGGALSEERLVRIRELDRALRLDDVIDISGKRRIDAADYFVDSAGPAA
jgi:hypothetical protein